MCTRFCFFSIIQEGLQMYILTPKNESRKSLRISEIWYNSVVFPWDSKKPPNRQFLIAPNCIFLRVVDKEKTRWNTVISAGFMIFRFVKVVPPGIEPGTQGFSVLCSTNWAMAPLFLVCGCKGRHIFWIYKFFANFLPNSFWFQKNDLPLHSQNRNGM